MRRLLKAVGIIFLVGTVAAGSVYLWLSDKYVVPIMMYHTVTHTPGHDLNNVSPESFRRQMDFLSRHGYQVISLHELMEGVKAKKKFNRKTVVITFDDGYHNNYSKAFPILKEYHFPATIFVIVGQIDQPGFLKLEEMKEMEAAGISFDSHTRDHAYLPDVTPESQREQIFDSKRILQEKLGHPVDYFSYPSGGYSEDIQKMVKEAGYKGACTTNRGYSRSNDDVYALRRIRFVDEWSSGLVMFAQLSGYYNLLRQPKSPH